MLDIKVDFALLLYDEFDGASITDANVVFRHGGRIVTPLRKREGFYVFCGLDVPEILLEINRPHYYKQQKRILKSCLDPGNPVEKVRLMRTYPAVFSDCEWLHGSCLPDTEVLAYSKEEIKLQIGKEKNRLTILSRTAGGLTGRRFALNKEDGGDFLLTTMLAPGVYQADKALSASSKGAQSMVRAYLSKSGPDGHYHIPIEQGHSGKISGTAYYDWGKAKWV